jgi:hypothetical protein
VLHNLLFCKQTVPKSWFSMDDLMEPNFDDAFNLYLGHRLDERHANDAACREKVHIYLSDKLQ